MLYYFEDLYIGQRFQSGTHRMEEASIRSFAEQFDPQPFHVDGVAAKTTFFAGQVASGWHTAAATMRLLVDGGLPFAGGLIGAGAQVTWLNPTRADDVIWVESEVIELRQLRSRPEYGMATVRSETRNQNSVVQVLIARLLVQRGAEGNKSTSE